LKRIYHPTQDGPFLLNLNPKIIGWKYLSFQVARLTQDQTLEDDSKSEEVVIVPLAGNGLLSFNDEALELGRDDLFRQKPDIAYLPPRTKYRLATEGGFEFAIGSAPADGRLPARIIRAGEIPSSVRGESNVKRGVSALADSDDLTERLTVYEIHAPSGNWSSFPPHRHDTRDQSSYHEETYYYRFQPQDGFAIQRIYTRDTDLDVAIPVQNGDVVVIHEGYHPVVNAPGTNTYYLNFLAGDVRKISAVNDPNYDWVGTHWEGNPIEIPLQR
jgi:5-deoxy-glucuronate isomerase